MLLRPALCPFDTVYATTDAELGTRDGIARMVALPDSNRHRPWQAMRCLFAAWRLVRRFRPEVIVTTGALPGLFCVVVGRAYGARAVWVDSIANSEHASLSGICARPFATLWLTQWEQLRDGWRVAYAGGVL